MKVTFITENDCCKSINVECTVIEWLVARKAMQFLRYAEDCHPKDIEILDRMINIEPIIEER